MPSKHRWFIVSVLVFLLSVSFNAYADSLSQNLLEIEAQSQSEMVEVLAISEAFARITGTAVSPALGLALLGGWDHFQGAEHWYVTPYLYVPLLLLVFLEWIKNTFGMAVFPGPIRKPLDAAFQLVGYLNANLGLVMSMGIAYEVFQPQVAMALQFSSEFFLSTAHAADPATTVALGGGLVGILAALCGAVIFLSIWLISHTFELMVFLCPFTSIDMLLKAAQQSFTALIIALAIVFPPAAVVICLLYWIFCLLMFSTCLRFSIFGVTMLWHFLFQRGQGRVNEPEEIVCFASHISGVKNNTRGTLSKQDGKFIFKYKRAFLYEQSAVIDMTGLCLIERFNYPSLNTKPNGWGQTRLVFSPRYLNQEQALSTLLEVELGAGLILSGYREALRFLRSQFFGKQTLPNQSHHHPVS